MRPFAVVALALSTVALAGCSGGGGGETPEVPGMVVYGSAETVARTVDKVEEELRAAGRVVVTVDHAANAASVGESLPPTVLVVGGDPTVGAPAVQQDARAGLELPMRFLVWADQGGTWVGFNSADYVAARAGIADTSVLDPLTDASELVAEEASGTATPVSEKEYEGVEVGNVEAAGSDDVAGTTEQLVTTLEEGAPQVVAEVDHAADAASADIELDPLTLTFAGDPEAGTPFLLASRTIGLDLPMRFLVAGDGSGGSTVLAPDVGDLAERHGISGMDDAVAAVQEAQRGVLDQATSGSGG